MQPMTIFFIWLGTVLPAAYKEKFQNCLDNYDNNCKLIGEKQQAFLVEKYDKKHPNNTIIQRADVLRLLVLQEYGGIYMDFDVQVNNWNYLKILQCQGQTFFSEEQITLINERGYRVGNWFGCSGKNTTEMQRLIDNIKPMPAHLSSEQILKYAGPGYLDIQKANYMITYPNIKHCYDNNWTTKRQGCQTPLYSYILYFGYDCFKLLGILMVLLIATFVYILKNYYIRKQNSEYMKTREYEDGQKINLKSDSI